MKREKQPAELRMWTWQGQTIPFVLERSVRKTFSLRLSAQGVRAGVPLAASEQDIERFLIEHSDWLLTKWRARALVIHPPLLETAAGTVFPVQGQSCVLALGPQRQALWSELPSGQFRLMLPERGDVRRAWCRALQARALAWFSGRVAEYCYRLDVPEPAVRLTRAHTRWGSCSRRSGIRLHWRLIHLPTPLAEYVVAHEVTHLIHMNHSPKFWRTLEMLYPNAREGQAQLQAAARDLPVIDLNDVQVGAPGFDTL